MNAPMTTDRLRWWQPLRDPAQERRFQDDKHAGGLNRVRVVLSAAILSVGLLGLMEMSNQVRRHPDFAFETLRLRFLVVAPIWLGALVSTGLPGHRARADTLYAVATVGVCWALALCKWHFAAEVTSEAMGQGVMIDVLAVLVLSAFTLPMRLGHLVVATLGVTVPTGLFMVVANPTADPMVGWNILVSLVGIGGWCR